MGKIILTDAYISVNGVNLSDHCSSVVLEDKADEIDVTSFGPSAYREYGMGMKDSTITATFYSDFAASSVHSTLQPLYQAGGTFAVIVKTSSGATSATNPTATQVSRLYSYSGIAGKAGDAATFDAAFRCAGTAGVVWATA